MLNSVTLIGRLTKDPKTKDANDTTKTTFRLAIDRGGDSDETDFLPVTVWGGSAKACGNYLSQGSKVAVDGNIRVYQYEKNGENRSFTYINANRVVFLDPKDNSDSSQEEPDEEVPF